MREEAVVVQFSLLSWNLYEGSEEYSDPSQGSRCCSCDWRGAFKKRKQTLYCLSLLNEWNFIGFIMMFIKMWQLHITALRVPLLVQSVPSLTVRIPANLIDKYRILSSPSNKAPACDIRWTYHFIHYWLILLPFDAVPSQFLAESSNKLRKPSVYQLRHTEPQHARPLRPCTFPSFAGRAVLLSTAPSV